MRCGGGVGHRALQRENALGPGGLHLGAAYGLVGADRVEGTLRMQRKEENWRLYDVEIERRATRGGRALGKQDVDAYSLS